MERSWLTSLWQIVILLFFVFAVMMSRTALSGNAAVHVPELVVKVVNGPEGAYRLDLLEEEEPGQAVNPNILPREDRDRPDADLGEALQAAVPEHWRACMAQGTVLPLHESILWEEGVHRFYYLGVPRTYRILVVTESGESWVSDTLERGALQTSVTVDWAAKTARVPPVWRAYALQILLTLLPALLAEFLLLLAFRLDWRKNWKVFLTVNLVTQGILSCVLGILVVRDGFISRWMLLFLGAEVVIAFVEAFLYRRFLQSPSRRYAFTYGLAANAAAATLGWFMVDFAWYMAVSIS